MRFTIDKSVLYKAVNKVKGAANNRSTLEPLRGILIETNGQSLKLTATDLSLAIQCIVEDVDVEVFGRVLIPAKFFSDLLRKLSGPITIETVFENRIKLSCGDLRATINALDHDGFPEMPVILGVTEMYIQTKILKTALVKTVFSSSSDDNRPIFTGILFKVSNGNIDFVATDTHRLSRLNYPTDFSGDIKAVVPGGAMREIGRSFDGEVTKMSFNDHSVEFECENMKLVTKLIQGEFPNYEAVIPKNPEAAILVNKALLKMAVQRADIFSDRLNRIIQIKGEDSLVISGSSSLFGDIRQIVKAEHNGGRVKVAFNCEFLLHAINAMDSENISLNYHGTHAPMTFCEDGYLQLILPVRVDWGDE